jgi:hypothetical protein
LIAVRVIVQTQAIDPALIVYYSRVYRYPLRVEEQQGGGESFCQRTGHTGRGNIKYLFLETREFEKQSDFYIRPAILRESSSYLNARLFLAVPFEL